MEQLRNVKRPTQRLHESRDMQILTVSSTDLKGGASRVAWRLHCVYRRLGHQSLLIVGRKYGDDINTEVITENETRGKWCRLWHHADSLLQSYGTSVAFTKVVGRIARGLAEPGKLMDYLQGIEDFRFPRTWHLFERGDSRPDIVHCHNLHGGYFDLRALPWLSKHVPVVLTLHDAWLLSGHCAHSFGCDRWKSGCGDCPDLTTYPSLRRDATAFNWRRKKKIFDDSRLFVASPSRWLMKKVEQSMLGEVAAQTRVIPYGVDLSVFQPAVKSEARRSLGLPCDARIILTFAPRKKRNLFKDYQTARAALELLPGRVSGTRLLYVALGDTSRDEVVEGAELRFVAGTKSEELLARYYQAADIYLHAAKEDTFPNVVIESLACGTPVVATAVGGIPEQIESLAVGPRLSGVDYSPSHRATGVLVSPENAEEMASAVARLIVDEPLRNRLSENAASDARQRFDLESQVDTYLTWYDELAEKYPPSTDSETIDR